MLNLKRLPLIIAAFTAIIMQACADGSEIGESIVSDNVQVVIDSAFTINGTTVDNKVVPSRTITQLIGVVDAPGYGTLSSENVTQFMPALAIDTTNVTAADIDSLSVKMLLNYGSFIGDSIAPMGLEVYPLTKQLPTPIYSNFDPTGYYDPTPVGKTVYNLSTYGEPDSIKSLGYHQISIKLPVEMGRKLFDDYKKNPAAFSSPTEFAKIFPGLYFRNTFGSGRVSYVANTTLQMRYHKTYFDTDLQKDTTTYHTGTYFAVTPEIICNNDINLAISPDIRQKVAEGQNIILAPAGLDVEIQFPIIDVINAYKRNITSLGIINSLTFSLPAEKIENKYNVGMPANILMVLKKDKEQFFAKNKLTDDKTSFYATYNTTTGTYDFNALRTFLIDCIQKYEEGTLTPEDYTFTLTPIYLSYETSSNSYYYGTTTSVSAITPYVSGLAMAKINLDKAKIKFIYTKQTVNF